MTESDARTPPRGAEPEPSAGRTAGAAGGSAAARWRRRGLTLAIVVAAIGLPGWGRVVFEGRAELRRAEAARSRHDVPAQIEHLGRALRWRAPLADHDERALDELWAIAQREQARGRSGRPLALVALRELRRGVLATRVGGLALPPRWASANERIAALMADQERDLGVETFPGADARALHRRRLDEVPGPEPWRADLAALAFLAWIASVAGFVTRGIDERGRLRPRAASRWGLFALLSLLSWTVMLATAHAGG